MIHESFFWTMNLDAVKKMERRKTNKTIPTLALIMALMLTVFLQVPPAGRSLPNPPGPYEYVLADISQPETVDPVKAYDTASCELICNVYETLIQPNVRTGEFMSELADSWTISPDGTTYTFHIRSGVQWQDPAYGMLKASDVEYSFERLMVRDYTDGPAWMLWEPLFGNHSADLVNPVGCGQAIDAAITSDDVAGTVTIQFATGLQYPQFMAILAQTWASVLSKAWAVAMGDWPGSGLQDGTWIAYHDPATSPLDGPPSHMMGTGPYKLDYLISTGWSIVKFDPYWGGWGIPLRRGFWALGYLNRVTKLFISDWATRYAGFLGAAPIYDSIFVPRNYIAQVWQQPGVICWYPQRPLSLDALFFTFDTGPNSPYIGNGQWGELGIIPTFFSDIHVRRAIAYSFDRTFYFNVGTGEGIGALAIPMKPELPFYDGSITGYSFDLAAAASEWAQAWDGLVLANGFNFTIAYPTGNGPRQTAALMIEERLEAQNPKFHVEVVSVPWPAFLGQLHSSQNGGRSIMPVFADGWTADFEDVHDFIAPFMASWGHFGFAQSLYIDPQSAYVDKLIDWGIHNSTYAKRDANYQMLYQIYVQEASSIPLVELLGRRWARDWVHGWWWSLLSPGSDAAYIGESVGSDFYSMWKEDITQSTAPFAGRHANWEDINEDGRVDIKDLATAAKAYGAYFIQPLLPPNPAGPPGSHSSNWNSKADVNLVNPASPDTSGRGDMRVDIKDLATIAKLFGFVADPWTPPT